MLAKTGEKTRTACTFQCPACKTNVKVKEAEPVPKCSGCGSTSFEMLTGELEVPGKEK